MQLLIRKHEYNYANWITPVSCCAFGEGINYKRFWVGVLRGICVGNSYIYRILSLVALSSIRHSINKSADSLFAHFKNIKEGMIVLQKSRKCPVIAMMRVFFLRLVKGGVKW